MTSSILDKIQIPLPKETILVEDLRNPRMIYQRNPDIYPIILGTHSLVHSTSIARTISVNISLRHMNSRIGRSALSHELYTCCICGELSDRYRYLMSNYVDTWTDTFYIHPHSCIESFFGIYARLQNRAIRTGTHSEGTDYRSLLSHTLRVARNRYNTG